jgi:alpha-L-arabinofuranosidase
MFAEMAEAAPVAVEISAAEQKTPMVLPELRNASKEFAYKTIDALAAVDDDKTLWISIVHRGTEKPIGLTISTIGFATKETAQIQTLSGEVPWAVNTLEKPTAISPMKSSAEIRKGQMELEIRPYSYVLVRINGSR